MKRPRVVLGLAVPALVLAAGGVPALASSGPAAAAEAVHGPAAPACTVTWVGAASRPLWTTGKNWSTGKVPGPSSDVCIGTGVDVLTSVSITVHSLHLGPEAGIALEGTSAAPLTATVATAVDLTGTYSHVDLDYATISAAQIDDPGIIYAAGTCSLSSPDIVVGDSGSVQAANGTTTLTSLPQLSDGTLTGGTFDTSDATLVLPGDITSLVSSNIGVGADSAIDDPAADNALTGLTSIDPQSSLLLDSGLSLTGSLTADGDVSLADQTLAIPGTFTQAQGTLSVGGTGTVSASQVLIDRGAFLQGNQGTIAGNLVNDGSVQASGDGATQVLGSYTQAPDAVLASGFGGPLAVTGQATLAGEVSSFEGEPETGATSRAITFGSRSGNFTSHDLGFNLLTKAHQIDVVTHPQIAASPTTVAPGHKVTVNGGSFGLGSSVTVYLDHTGGTPLGTTEAGYGGRFAVTVRIPASATAGPHRIVAVGSDGSRAKTTITVS